MKNVKVRACALALFGGVASLTSTAGADVVFITSFCDDVGQSDGYGQEGNGAFTGSISYSGGTLVISLTNDASSLAGGKITGFVFNINGNASAALTGTSHAAFANLAGSPSASPFGTFEEGAAMGGSWLGGGSPNAGITVGNTGTFTFSVTGPDAGSLTAADFISELSTSGTPSAEFAVRFRGFDNGGSDKTLGCLVPAPGALAALSFAGLVATRRRR